MPAPRPAPTPIDPARCLDGAALKDALQFVLLACPKASEEMEHLAHVMWHGPSRRLIASDGHRFHEARLAASVAAWPSFACKRESAVVLQKHLTNTASILRTRGAADETYLVEMMPWDPDDPNRTPHRIVRIHSSASAEPVVLELKTVAVGPVAMRWDPPVPEDAPRLGGIGDGRKMDPKFVAQACGWPGDGFHVTWRGFGDSPVRFDVLGHEGVVATATVLPVGQRATMMDERQEELFRERTQRHPGRSVLALRLDFAPPTPTSPCEHGVPPGEFCERCEEAPQAASAADTPGLRAAIVEIESIPQEETGAPAGEQQALPGSTGRRRQRGSRRPPSTGGMEAADMEVDGDEPPPISERAHDALFETAAVATAPAIAESAYVASPITGVATATATATPEDQTFGVQIAGAWEVGDLARGVIRERPFTNDELRAQMQLTPQEMIDRADAALADHMRNDGRLRPAVAERVVEAMFSPEAQAIAEAEAAASIGGEPEAIDLGEAPIEAMQPEAAASPASEGIAEEAPADAPRPRPRQRRRSAPAAG